VVLGAPPLSGRWFRGRGSATARRATRGGSTVKKPPISRTLNFRQVGGMEDPPTVDLGRTRSDGWRNGQGSGGIRDGAHAIIV